MVNLLKSVCCRNLLKHAKDENSSGVTGRLFQLCITRFEKSIYGHQYVTAAQIVYVSGVDGSSLSRRADLQA